MGSQYLTSFGVRGTVYVINGAQSTSGIRGKLTLFPLLAVIC